MFRALQQGVLISIDKRSCLNALFFLKPHSRIKTIWVHWAGNGERIIWGLFLILFKQTEDSFWQEACLTSVTEYRIIMGKESVFLNWVCFLEINVDLRLLTSQSKSFQVVWDCESLGGKPWYPGRGKKHKPECLPMRGWGKLNSPDGLDCCHLTHSLPSSLTSRTSFTILR